MVFIGKRNIIMDFSTFKSITIDGNAITKIEIGGNTVWQEDTGTTEEYSGLTCVFNITETGSTFLGYGNNHPSTIIVDGTEESWSSYYNFTTTGEHIVKFPYSYLAGRNFQDVQALTSVHIGSGCTKMSGRDYFKNCENLTAITVSDKSTIYDSRDNCNAIIKTSTNTMVQGCKTTTIPSTVTAIGEAAFAEIPITAITIPENVTSLEDWALCGTDLVEVTIPSTVTSYGMYIFEGCSKLEKITTPSLGYSFCHECTSLKEVVFSNASISYINERAFEDCTSLTSITIPNSVTSIDYNAFQNCSGLTSATLPANLTSIGDYAFQNCSSLTELKFNNYKDIWKNNVSKGDNWLTGAGTDVVICLDGDEPAVYYEEYTATLTTTSDNQIVKVLNNTSNTGYVKIDDVKQSSVNNYYTIATAGEHTITYGYASSSFASQQFGTCDIETIEIPTGFSLDTRVFEYSKLKTCTLPSDLSTLNEEVFYHCEELTGLTIPANVTKIYKRFAPKCPNLVSLVVDTDNTTYDSRDNCNAIIETSTNKMIYSCASTTIPASVTALGDGAFDDNNGIKKVVIPKTVTSIGDWVFSYTSGMTDCIIESEITEIGGNMFSGCYALSSLTLPATVTSTSSNSFQYCEKLKEIHFGGTTEQWKAVSIYSWGDVPDDVIIYCTDGKVDKNGNVTKYETRVVCVYNVTQTTGNTQLTYESLTLSNHFTSMEVDGTEVTLATGYTFTTTGEHTVKYTLKDNTTIGSKAFYNCTSLTSVTIGNSVTTISDKAFYECTGLTSVVIPDSVTSIGEFTFNQCTSLTSVVIPNSVTTISGGAFYQCTGLTSVVIPDSVTSIDSFAFSECTGLTSVTIPDSVTSIGESAFNNTPWYKSYSADTANQYGNIIYINNVAYQATSTGITSCEFKEGTVSISIYTFNQCTSLTSVVIPDSVTTISDKAFYECTGLTSVTIGNSVTSIGYYAFFRCTSLTSVTIGNSVTSIGYCTFYQCTGLTSVVIPNSVTSIGYYAFNGCSGLTSVTIPDSVTSISDRAFYQCTKLETITYNGTVAQWETITKGSSWNDSVPATKVTCSDGEVTL